MGTEPAPVPAATDTVDPFVLGTYTDPSTGTDTGSGVVEPPEETASLHMPGFVMGSEGPVSEEASAAEHLSGVLAHALDGLLDSYPKTVADLVEKTTDVVGGLAHAVGEVLSGLFGGGTDGSSTGPSVPHNIPVPASPTPVPAEGSSTAVGSLSSVSGSSGSTSVLLLAVLILFSSTLFQGGKLSWYCREPLKPRSAPQLAIERPG